MNWKAIYKDGTEIKEGDTLSTERAILHDGVDTGKTEPQPASPVLLDMKQLAQFLVQDSEGKVIFNLSLTGNKLIFVRRNTMDLKSGVITGSYFLVGTIDKLGNAELSSVYDDGTVIEGSDIDIDFTSQLQLTT